MTIYNYFKFFKRNVRIALVSVFTSVFKLLYKVKKPCLKIMCLPFQPSRTPPKSLGRFFEIWYGESSSRNY